MSIICCTFTGRNLPEVANGADFDAILFDLDGTLVDTAPDMVAVLAEMLQFAGRESVSYEVARSHVSHGSAGLIRMGFPDVADEELERLCLDYLDRYERTICVHSAIFAGLEDLLKQLDDNDIPWGVVTNKPARMTEPLLAALGLTNRVACQISGDTIPQRKPHPAPLLLASKLTGIAPDRTVYVGDAARDIEAGQAAGMCTIAVAYGYITSDDDPATWQADRIAADIQELTTMLLKGVNLGTS
jgi:N-acetyl-D-muramate 6-phosphate phosphatase